MRFKTLYVDGQHSKNNTECYTKQIMLIHGFMCLIRRLMPVCNVSKETVFQDPQNGAVILMHVRRWDVKCVQVCPGSFHFLCTFR